MEIAEALLFYTWNPNRLYHDFPIHSNKSPVWVVQIEICGICLPLPVRYRRQFILCLYVVINRVSKRCRMWLGTSALQTIRPEVSITSFYNHVIQFIESTPQPSQKRESLVLKVILFEICLPHNQKLGAAVTKNLNCF